MSTATASRRPAACPDADRILRPWRVLVVDAATAHAWADWWAALEWVLDADDRDDLDALVARRLRTRCGILRSATTHLRATLDAREVTVASLIDDLGLVEGREM